jgi:serine/threonine protein kinase
MPDWIGRTLGRVRIESLVARGGMAEVYLGTHTTLQRSVAVKILRNLLEDDPRPRERFELEARAVAQLRHPNIVQVFDFDTIDGQPFIVMEYIRGPSLSKYLSALHARSSRLELPHVSRLLSGVANALQYAHESNVIHRDVKPGNILLTSRSLQIVPGETIPLDFDAVLTDFGLVRILNSTRQTTIGQTAGTPAYMSPEQAMGLTTDGRTDIYSLGIVLYEMLSGDVPFDGETTMSVLLKHLNEAPAPIPNLHPELQKVLDRALSKTADDRYDTPKEFADAFNTALKETADASTVAAVTRVAIPPKEEKPVPLATPKRRSFWGPAILAGILLALLSAAVVFNGIFPMAAATITPTTLLLSDTPTLFAAVALGPTGVLQLHDGSGIMDQATLIAQAMPAPPAGSQYEVWLVNGGERLALGILSVDGEGRGKLIYKNVQRSNLLATYSGVEVTIKAGDGSNANESERVAYFYSLPDAGLVFLRGLMVSSPTTPEQVSLMHGLEGTANLMEQSAREMLNNYENGNEAGTKESAEALMNLLAGGHKDWNGDKQIIDPGDGYGLLLNADHLGYIQAVYAQADYAVNASGASRNIIVNGENVKTCTQNLARWAGELRNQLMTILNAASLSEMDSAVQRSAALADQILNGIDLNENGTVDALAEECGVLVAYDAAYRMADMPLLPVNPLDTPTPNFGSVTPTQTATPGLLISATPTKLLDDSPTDVPPQITNEPPPQPTNEPPPQPTNEPPPQPTRKPKPTPKPTKDKP